MTHSVRLRLVDRLQRVGNHLTKQVIKVLRGYKVHAQPGVHDGLGFIARVKDGVSGRQVNDAVEASRFGDEVDQGWRNASLLNDPRLVPNSERLSTTQDGAHFANSPLIAHQNFSLCKNYDLGTLNARVVGVQPRERA